MIVKNLKKNFNSFKYNFSFKNFSEKRFFMLKCDYIEDMHYKRSKK